MKRDENQRGAFLVGDVVDVLVNGLVGGDGAESLQAGVCVPLLRRDFGKNIGNGLGVSL